MSNAIKPEHYNRLNPQPKYYQAHYNKLIFHL